VYISDAAPGIRRRSARRDFEYLDRNGKVVRDPKLLARIRRLAIPPAWTSVWICAKPAGHIQATGRDARGRKQYRYHPQWRQLRETAKFDKMIDFGRALPSMRRHVQVDLGRAGLSRRKVVAAIVHLLDTTLLRVGNDEYARTNGSYGLTTLLDRHARVHGSSFEFRFRGKTGKALRVELTSPRLARIIRRCREIPGQRLFQYLDERGRPRSIGSSDVNRYLRAISGEDFTAKDFRTWGGSKLAAHFMVNHDGARRPIGKTRRRNVTRLVERVAFRMGNTPAICKKAYIHPALLEACAAGTFFVATGGWRAHRLGGRSILECQLLAFLERNASISLRPERVLGRRTMTAAHQLQLSLAATP